MLTAEKAREVSDYIIKDAIEKDTNVNIKLIEKSINDAVWLGKYNIYVRMITDSGIHNYRVNEAVNANIYTHFTVLGFSVHFSDGGNFCSIDWGEEER